MAAKTPVFELKFAFFPANCLLSRGNRTDVDVGRDAASKMSLIRQQRRALKCSKCGLVFAMPPVPRRSARPRQTETSAGGRWRCCQSNRNSSPIDAASRGSRLPGRPRATGGPSRRSPSRTFHRGVIATACPPNRLICCLQISPAKSFPKGRSRSDLSSLC